MERRRRRRQRGSRGRERQLLLQRQLRRRSVCSSCSRRGEACGRRWRRKARWRPAARRGWPRRQQRRRPSGGPRLGRRPLQQQLPRQQLCRCCRLLGWWCPLWRLSCLATCGRCWRPGPGVYQGVTPTPQFPGMLPWCPGLPPLGMALQWRMPRMTSLPGTTACSTCASRWVGGRG